MLSAAILMPRNLHYRRLEAEELIDADNNGIPDTFEQPANETAHEQASSEHTVTPGGLTIESPASAPFRWRNISPIAEMMSCYVRPVWQSPKGAMSRRPWCPNNLTRCPGDFIAEEQII